MDGSARGSAGRDLRRAVDQPWEGFGIVIGEELDDRLVAGSSTKSRIT
jgi:hypothetical protein